MILRLGIWIFLPPRSLHFQVCLPDLLDRVGGLDEELDWSHVLSGGEQQRVAFLRLFLHRPQLAFLDEVGLPGLHPDSGLFFKGWMGVRPRGTP